MRRLHTVASATALGIACLGLAVPAQATAQTASALKPADQSQGATRYVVGLGDSYMSGEGASWAAKNWRDSLWWAPKSQRDQWRVGAFGNNLQETYPGDFTGLPGDYCHRSAVAPMMVGGNWQGVNLACSGATVYSQRAGTKSGAKDKPGVDFTMDGFGQANQLAAFATKAKQNNQPIDAVVLSIGGNDVGFAKLVEECATKFVTPFASACHKATSGPVAETKQQIATELPDKVSTALTNVHQAMLTAGYQDGSYRILYQIPPVVVTSSADIDRTMGGDSSWDRQDWGGCPFTDGDLDMFYNQIAPSLTQQMKAGVVKAKAGELKNVPVSVVQPSFDGHELCSKYAMPKENGPNFNSTSPQWDQYSGQGGEWAAPIIMGSVINSAVTSRDLATFTERYPNLAKALNYDLNQADGLPMHPNYWGQRALANCHTQVLQQSESNAVFTCKPAVAKGQKLQLVNGMPDMAVAKAANL